MVSPSNHWNDWNNWNFGMSGTRTRLERLERSAAVERLERLEPALFNEHQGIAKSARIETGNKKILTGTSVPLDTCLPMGDPRGEFCDALCRERELLLFQIPNQRLGVRSR